MAIASVNPATGETIRTFDALDDAAIDAALARSASAFHVNRSRSFSERAPRMRRAAEIQLLSSRGVHPLALGLKAVLETAPAAISPMSR